MPSFQVIQGFYDVEASVRKAQTMPIVQKVRRVQFAGWLREGEQSDAGGNTTTSSSDEGGGGAGRGGRKELDPETIKRRRRRQRRRQRRRRRKMEEIEDSAALGKLSEDYRFLNDFVS